jgi:hypothetical protein
MEVIADSILSHGIQRKAARPQRRRAKLGVGWGGKNRHEKTPIKKQGGQRFKGALIMNLLHRKPFAGA